MTIDKLLSTIILVAFLVTIILAVGSYAAYKWRESRRPKASEEPRTGEPVYFEKLMLGGDDSPPDLPDRRGAARGVALICLTVVGLSVALVARGERARAPEPEPMRFPGARAVIPLPSVLPRPQLSSTVLVALVRDPAAASYYGTATTYDSVIARWTDALRTAGAEVRVLAPPDLGRAGEARVLVVPSARCLSVATREAIERAATRGQGIVVTGPVGTLDARCRPVGYGLLVALTGASRVDTLEKREIAYVTIPGGSPLATGIPPGARLELDPAPYVAVRRQGRDAFFSTFTLQPAPAGGAPLLDGAMLRARYRRARVVHWGFELTGIGRLPWDRAVGALLVRNAVAWAASEPMAELEPWPRGKHAAAVLAQDVEDQFANAAFALDTLQVAGVRSTFFLTSQLARRHERLTRAIARHGEVGTHSENHRLLGGQPADVQRDRLTLTQRELRDQLGTSVRGLRPPYEQFDTATFSAWLAAGGSYVFGSNNSRVAAPELLAIGGDTLVLLGRANVDDYDAVRLASEGGLDALVREYLAEYQKVRALRGLYLLSYHSQILARPELVPALGRIARRLRADTALWLTTAGDVADWWRARAAVDLAVTRAGPRALRIVVRNRGPIAVSGLVARIALDDGTRARQAPVKIMTAEPGTVRLLLPTLPPGATRTYRVTLTGS